MKKLLMVTASVLAFSVSSAYAADMGARPYTKAPPPPPAPVLIWNGFYLGVQGGGGWGNSDETFFLTPNSPAFLGSQSFDTSGGFAGGVIGYNWQIGQTVLGIEGDYHWADISGRSAIINIGPPNLLDTYFTQLRSFGDIKGRLGYAAGPALWFISGGAAVGELRHRYDAALNGGLANTFAQTDTRWGWTAGAGVEYMFTPNWSGKIEYNYIDLGKSTIQYTPLIANRSEFNDTFHTVKVGLNYHFNWTNPYPVARY
ncbi:outer membrane protein [Bradyrhizobium lablabi]|uniref:outer membrane protein n=1 Tax=Bradyrhizobium lablabi TaxID=722472 RepID=UPI001BA8DE7E|nr:outer membrane beta-barrel protein [Bradyrhizobium lablabi]MBR0693497.1 porin family protein [Bradyrhizobium lablabi]